MVDGGAVLLRLEEKLRRRRYNEVRLSSGMEPTVERGEKLDATGELPGRALSGSLGCVWWRSCLLFVGPLRFFPESRRFLPASNRNVTGGDCHPPKT